MHFLHTLFSVLVGIHSTARRLFVCLAELPEEGLPPVVKIPVKDFSVRHSVRAIMWADHMSYL